MKTQAKLRLIWAFTLGLAGVGGVLLLLGTATGVSAGPATWYVAPDGVDSPTCGTVVSPCLTINYAISQASVGATIFITPGTFTESLTLNKALTLTGVGMGQTVIRTGSPGITLTADNSAISGTTIVGQGGGEGVVIAASHTNVSLLNNEVQSYDTGIWLDGGNGHVLQGNTIAGNSIGIVAAGNLAFVASNNTIGDSLTAGVLFTGTGPITATLSGASAHANVFRNNATNITVTLPSTNAAINAYWNDWGASTIASIESSIYHEPDDASLARVDYYTLTVAAAPPTVVADGITPAYITGTLTGFITPGAGDVISFTASLGTLSGITSTTNASGQASVSLTSTVAGTATITATSGIALNNVRTATTTVSFAAGSPYTITLEAVPLTTVVGNNSVLTATVVDQFGNWVADDTVVTFGTDLGRVQSPRTTTNGTATSLISSTLAGVANVTADSGTAPQAGITVNFVPDVPNRISLQAVPLTTVVGINSVLTATVVDQFGNWVADDTVVTFATDLGRVQSPRTTKDGTATSLISSTIAGPANVTADSGTAPQAGITVNFVPDVPNSMSLWADPTLLTVGGTSYVQAYIKDRFGNSVANGTLVTFTTDLGSMPSPRTTIGGFAYSPLYSAIAGTAHITATSGPTQTTTSVTFEPDDPYMVTLQANPISPTVGYNSVLTATVTDRFGNQVADGKLVPFTADHGSILSPGTTTNGIATSLISDTLAGTQFITATCESAQPGRTTVTFRPDAPHDLALQADPLSQVVGNNSVLTATVRDQYTNLVESGIPVTFTVSRGYVVSHTLTTNGIATSLISDTLVGVRLVTATTTRAVSDTTTVTFIPGAPYSLTLAVAPTTQVVGHNSVLTATVYDQFSNFVANGTSVTFGASGGSIVSPVPTTNGIATSLVSDTLIGTRTVTATSGSAPSITRTVTFIPGAPYTITVEVYPADLIANSGATATVTATLIDSYSNPIAGEGLTASFAITNMGAVSMPLPTNSAGQAIGTWTAGSVVTQALLYVSNGSITGTHPVSLISGEPETILVQPGSPTLIANSGMTSTITVLVMDGYGNKPSGVSVNGVITPSTLGGLSEFGFTNADGQSFGTWTAGSVMTRGVLSVRWSNGSISGTTPVTLTHGVPQSVTIKVNPPTLAAFSGVTATVAITVTDLYYNRIQGQGLTGSTSPNTLGSVSGLTTTNVNGQASGLWTATPHTVAGTGELRVQAAGAIGTTPITLTPGHLYLPVSLGNYATPILYNSDFSRGLEGWSHNLTDTLPVSAAYDPISPTNQVTLLGSPAFACNNVPVGYGSLSQSFVMPNVSSGQLVLKFKYHIITFDKNIRPDWYHEGDTFEVLINNTLIYADMRKDGLDPDCIHFYEIGPTEASVPVTGIAGSTMNVTFRVHNGSGEFADNNTYVYLDDVRLDPG